MNRYFLLLLFVVPCGAYAMQNQAIPPKLAQVHGMCCLSSNNSFDTDMESLLINPGNGVAPTRTFNPDIVRVKTSDGKVVDEQLKHIAESEILYTQVKYEPGVGYVVRCDMTHRQYSILVRLLRKACYITSLDVLVDTAQDYETKQFFGQMLHAEIINESRVVASYEYTKWKQYLKMVTQLRMPQMRFIAIGVGKARERLQHPQDEEVIAQKRAAFYGQPSLV